MANGAILKTEGFCGDVPVNIQGEWFHIQFHALTLGECDVMLGTQWLSTLGLIQWDFKLLTMSFSHGGHQVFFKGLQPLGSHYQGSNEFFKAPVRKG